MNKDSIIDYFRCILFRAFGPFIRSLPLRMSLFLGRSLGELFYCFDRKHRAIAYSNIKTGLGKQLSLSDLKQLTRDFYRTFGQNIMEIFFIPRVTKEYINKYISFEGLDYINEGFKKGKGVILLGMHEGSWELSNIICASLGFPFSLFIRVQRYHRLNNLLNSYRSQKGCRLIQRQNQIREMIKVLKDNQAIGMTLDQGGKSGTQVKFLGRNASMSTGAVKLALKYDAALIPAFYTRSCGPHIKVIIEPPFKIKRTANQEKDIRDNLQELVHIFEKNILRYPQEYLWSYKIWKYTNEKNLLILSDGKAGHLRQSEALAQIIKSYFKDKGISTNIDIQEVNFKSKSKFYRYALTLSATLAGKYHCQGCLECLRRFLKSDTYSSLIKLRPDIVISCGSSLAVVNFVLSCENLAKSVVIMKPSLLGAKRFDLVIIPRHDSPPKRKNIVITEGALNLINDDYLKEQSQKFRQLFDLRYRAGASSAQLADFNIGLLIGGDTKNFVLEKDSILKVAKQIKDVSKKLGADILVTTSRRTKPEVENLIKQEFSNYSHCKLLIIANEKNIPGAVGGILGLSEIVVITCESISMISEAVNSQKYVFVFDSQVKGRRHKRFLEHFARNKYIYLVSPFDLSKKVEEIWLNRPAIHTSRDNYLVAEAIKKIL